MFYTIVWEWNKNDNIYIEYQIFSYSSHKRLNIYIIFFEFSARTRRTKQITSIKTAFENSPYVGMMIAKASPRKSTWQLFAMSCAWIKMFVCAATSIDLTSTWSRRVITCTTLTYGQSMCSIRETMIRSTLYPCLCSSWPASSTWCPNGKNYN